MNTSNLDLKAKQLQQFLRGLSDFPGVSEAFESYDHMGATLTDAVLQAGLNYENTVKPRVERVKELYPQVTTTQAFRTVVDTVGAAHVLDVANEAKQQRLIDLLALLAAVGLQTEEEVRVWLTEPEHRARLQTIKGIKTKTCHYLQILCGERDAVAVDVNLRTAFARAGVEVADDEELEVVVKRTAALLEVTPAGLDFALWSWVASGRETTGLQS